MTKTFEPSRPIWCAGCGDFGVLQALVNARDSLNIAAHDSWSSQALVAPARYKTI